MKSAPPLRLLLVIPALLSLLPSNHAQAAPFQRARVSQIVNNVNVIEPQKGSRPAKVDEEVAGQMAVRTGVESRSELVFPDDTVTRLGSNTLFSFRKGTRDMKMEHGVMLLQAPKGAGGAKISTGAVTAAITGTTIMWEVPPPGTPENKKFIKLICIEANKDGARFYFNDRPLDSIIVPPGHMLIVPPGVKSLLHVEPVPINIKRLLRTSLLIQGMSMQRWVTPFTLSVIDPVLFEQERMFARKELLPTNLVIDGGGTSVLIATNYRRNADGTLGLERPPVREALPVSSPSPTPPPPSPTPAAEKFGALAEITSPNPYRITAETAIRTDPFITTNGVTDIGKTYRNEALDGPLTNYLFGSTNFFDELAGLNDLPGNQGVFKFSNLILAGNPTIDTTDGPTDVLLASSGDIVSGAPGGNFTLSGLTSLSLIANGNIVLGPEINFIIPDALPRSLNIAARGPESFVSLSNTIVGSGLALSVGAATDLFIDAFLDTSSINLLAGNDVHFGTTVISADTLEVTSLNDILLTPFDTGTGTGTRIGAQSMTFSAWNSITLDPENFVFLDGDTFTVAAGTINPTGSFNFHGDGGPLVTATFAAGTGGINAFDGPSETVFDLTGFEVISSTGGDIVAGDIGSLTLTTTGGGSVFGNFVYGGTFNIDGDLFADQVSVQNLTVNGTTDVNGLGAMNFTGAAVSAFMVTPFLPGGTDTHTVSSLDSDGGILFDNSLPGGPAGSLTLNIPTALFDTSAAGAIGAASFNGGDGDPSLVQGGGDGGTFIVNATGTITVNTPIEATTGIPSAGPSPTAPPAPSGKGGTVNLNSTSGAITVNDRIEVSSNNSEIPGEGRASAEGGNISIDSQVADATQVAVNITNSAQLYSLLADASPGPGGTIVIQSSGGQIVAGTADIVATNGTVEIRNNGAAGTVALNGTQIAADVVKIGALGANGVLNVQAGTWIDANSTMKLYGGLTAGEVHFSGAGTVNLNAGSTIDIAAKTVTIDQVTSVNNDAPTTRVSADNRNYNTTGFGNFIGDSTLIEQGANQAPPFD